MYSETLHCYLLLCFSSIIFNYNNYNSLKFTDIFLEILCNLRLNWTDLINHDSNNTFHSNSSFYLHLNQPQLKTQFISHFTSLNILKRQAIQKFKNILEHNSSATYISRTTADYSKVTTLLPLYSTKLVQYSEEIMSFLHYIISHIHCTEIT